MLEEIKIRIREAVGSEAAVFTYPSNPDFGNLSLACFELAKNQKKNPAELARELAESLRTSGKLKGYVSETKAAGPYLNFFIDPLYLAESVCGEVKGKGERFGRNQDGEGKRVMIEFSNGNTHKEYHVGHLRNISFGAAVTGLLEANGFAAIPVSYINDFGIHVAKTLWNWQRDRSYSQSAEPKGYLLGRCYSEASRKLADNPEGKAQVGAIMKEIESRQGAQYRLWEETRRWSIDYFASIYKELGIRFDHYFYESEEIAGGLKLVAELFEKGILTKSEGAIIANLEEYGLGVLPIIRTDGTALYPVADLALASEKFRLHNLDRSIYVVDVRQSLYFKQLFKILELMGYRQKMIHLTYDFVTLPEGMMSSRTGNVITYRELSDKVRNRLVEETAKRHPDWSAAQIDRIASSLTVSTIKFEMLKVSSDKIITFNINEALRFDGYTACYLQYGYARLKSILRKEGWNLFSRRPDLSVLAESKEKELLLKIARYPEAVADAGRDYDPSELAKYLFELVQLSNDYYHSFNILKAEPKVRRARLLLVRTIVQVIGNGFGLLGMAPLEEM